MTIIWCMVPEICSVKDRIFFFFMTPEVCSDWLLRYAAWETEFSVILNHFEPFYPHKNLKNQNFKKMKETPGDIIILHKCTKFIIICYTVPEIRCLMDVILIFYFGLFFALLTAQKIKISKKWKKHLEISLFYTCVPKIMITWCTIPEIIMRPMDIQMDRWTDGKNDI